MHKILCVLLLGLVIWTLMPATVLAGFCISPGIVNLTVPANKTHSVISKVSISNQGDSPTQYHAYAGLPNAPTQINPEYAVIGNLIWVKVNPEYVAIEPKATTIVTVTLNTPDSLVEGKQKFWLFVADMNPSGNVNLIYATKFLITISNQAIETNQTIEANQTIGINQTFDSNTTLTMSLDPGQEDNQGIEGVASNSHDRLAWWVYALIIGWGLVAIVGLTALGLRRQ